MLGGWEGAEATVSSSRRGQRLKRGPVATSLTCSIWDAFKIFTLKTWKKNKYLRNGTKIGKHNNHLT